MTVLAVDRPRPPRVRQRRSDTCWAAALEGWSRATPGFPHQQQSALVTQYGEGPTGGITPSLKVPLIAGALNLHFGAFPGPAALIRIRASLPTSYVLCAHVVGTYTHVVVIHAYDDEASTVSVMDPDGGRYDSRPMSWFAAQATGVILLWR